MPVSARSVERGRGLMFRLKTRHFLTGEELTRDELMGLIELAIQYRAERGRQADANALKNQTLAMLFEKPSLRTRFSFSVAMQQLGGSVVESLSSTSKKEEPEDVARVLGGYVDGIMLRTHDQRVLERMASRSPIPVINGLSDSHHPCQALADLSALQQRFGSLKGLRLLYLGDGNNVLHSLLLLGPLAGVHVSYSCPKGHEPNALIVKKARARAKEGGGSVTACPDPVQAAVGVHALYTDVWTSMGFESPLGEDVERERLFEHYQLNETIYAKAAPGAVVMHCLPMVRGKEITDGLADHPNSVIFLQSEYRLHAQKALLVGLLGGQATAE